MTLFEELKRRGLIAQMSHPDKVEDLINNQKATFYIGFDATADSLHVGHFLQLTVIKRLQQAGHTPILLLGTGTTMIGDPSGKTDMRKMLSVEEINYNADRFLEQMARIVDISEGKVIVERNGDWLMKLNYIELLRDIGVHFSVNRMLAAECFKSRLENGLSFIEFNYMIMQSYDYLYLHRKYGCTLQIGGDDQWSNILSGMDLVRRVEAKEAYAMTFTLLTTKEGKKMGKTEKGAIWLDPNKTSPFEFFQYWRNVDDSDVINCLKMLTFVPIEELEEMDSWEGSRLNEAKELLAYELTKDVHGKEEADKALAAARALFGKGVADENMPQTALSESDFENGSISLADLMVKTGLAPSKGEARRLVKQGGVAINDEKAVDGNQTLAKEQFAGEGVILRRGKKVFHRVVLG
ncbi:MAG TPA: tyrosine--tRNA ligase [Clostridiales bacterium]|nr:tyrosine--tRNA ligase [Clostridiales bacterium]